MDEDRADQRRRFDDVDVARWTAMVIVVFAYGWWAVSRPPFSGLATMAVVVPGAAAAVLGSLRRGPERHGPRAHGAGWWGILLAAALCWQLAAYLQHPRADHPTVSALTNALLDRQSIRATAFSLWLFACAGLARR